MKKAKSLFRNILLLTATTLLMRTVGVSFTVYLSGKIGSVGIGIFQLILSVDMLAITFATSGVRFASTRLVSEETGLRSLSGADRAVKCCLCYAAVCGTAAALFIHHNAVWIGTEILNETRTIPSLRLLSLTLPLVSMSAVLSGYFIAVRQSAKGVAIQILEQLVKIGATVAALSALGGKGLEYACAAIVTGSCAGEAVSFLLLFTAYRIDIRAARGKKDGTVLGMLPRLLGISVPIALSAYARSGLSTLQNLLIPRGLEKYGASQEASFTAYGTVHGMVLPVILYPSALLTVLSDLLLPELTECQVRHGRTHMNYIVNRVFKLSLIFSFLVMGVLFCCSSDLGKAVYQNEDVSFYIRIFSPLVIVMYMDTVVDGMLKGLGEQLNSMKYNIIDSFVSVLLVFFLLPHFGIEGYIATVMLSEVLNFSLSLGKLIQITELRVHLLDGVGKPLACIVLSALLCTKFLFVRLAPAGASLVPTLAFQILMISGVYFCLLFLCRSLTGEDLRWFRTLL